MDSQASLAPASCRTLESAPGTLPERVARLAAELGETLVPAKRRAGQSWVGLTTSHAVYVAYDATSHARIHAEAERLAWAAGCGLPVPQVLISDCRWLVTSRVANDDPLDDGSYATAAVDAA